MTDSEIKISIITGILFVLFFSPNEQDLPAAFINMSWRSHNKAQLQSLDSTFTMLVGGGGGWFISEQIMTNYFAPDDRENGSRALMSVKVEWKTGEDGEWRKVSVLLVCVCVCVCVCLREWKWCERESGNDSERVWMWI